MESSLCSNKSRDIVERGTNYRSQFIQTILISIFSISCPIELKFVRFCEIIFQTDAQRSILKNKKSFIPKQNLSQDSSNRWRKCFTTAMKTHRKVSKLITDQKEMH